MATEKQIDYIRDLIDRRRLENMDWWNQEITGKTDLDIELGTRAHQATQKEFILNAIGTPRHEIRRRLRTLTIEEALALYRDYIADLDALNLDAMSTQDASQLIDTLKATFR